MSTKRAAVDLNEPSSKKSRASDEEDIFENEGSDDEEDDEDFSTAPGMVSDLTEAKRWWECNDGFDFVKSRNKVNEDEGMRVDVDPNNLMNKLVKRFFNNGLVVSYGKVVGWFPPEKEGDEILYHILHGDADEEDLDILETKEGIAAAKVIDRNDNEDVENDRVKAQSLKSSDIAIKRKEEAKAEALHEANRTTALIALLKNTPKYKVAATDSMEAAVRGVAYIFQLSKDDGNLVRFGSDLVQTLYDISCVAPEPLRQAALQRVEVVSQRWKMKLTSLTDFAEDASLGVRPDEVIDAIMGIYSLERVGLEHILKQQVCDYLKRANFSPKHFIGFDMDRLNPLLDSKHKEDKFTILTSALNTAYFATKVGITLGAASLSGSGEGVSYVTLGGVLNHVRYIRPYKLPNDMEHEDWVDQITLVFNVVHVCSNFGELRLRPSLLPSEINFLEDQRNMDHALKHKDVHIIGELCHCLRVFGHTPNRSPLLDQGIEFLLTQQRTRDGSWPTRGGDEECYTKYHAAMCATMALYEPVFRGFGPGSSELTKLIAKWNRRDKVTPLSLNSKQNKSNNKDYDINDGDDVEDQGIQDDQIGVGVLVPSLSAVEPAYSGAINILHALKSGLGMVASGEKAGEERLDALLRWKLAVAEQTPSGFGRTSAKTKSSKSASSSSSNKAGAGRSSAASRKRAVQLSESHPSSVAPLKKSLAEMADLVDTDEEYVDDLL